VRQLSQPRQRHPGSKERKTFYTGLTWYRVVPGFVIQSGNPGLRDTDDLPAPVTPHFPDEFAPGLGHDASGILSMANAGPDTSSCEFFLTLAPTPRLNYLHAVLGRTVRGLEILPQIRQDDDASIKIIRVGPAAEAFHPPPPPRLPPRRPPRKHSQRRAPPARGILGAPVNPHARLYDHTP
jgi:cyclophilin family peptidyl-prolyl cis-trans isomerase